jgi:hypothetical protein
MNVSAAQHNGKPAVRRDCQPEFKACNMWIEFTGENGKHMIVREAEDANGKLLDREICEFNQFDDVRECVDFDSGRKRQDMRGQDGRCSTIGDQ